jgi:hypothetical protein
MMYGRIAKIMLMKWVVIVGLRVLSRRLLKEK